MQFTIKVYKDGFIDRKARTHRIRRFLKIPRSIRWENSTIKVYIKVNYGKFLDNHGRYVNFYNDGTYENRNSLWEALNAFLED